MTTSLNVPIIKLLVKKDWQLFEKWMAMSVIAGIVSLCLLGAGKAWSFYLGSLLLIIVLVSISCFSISTSLINERKERTLPFIMSLPVSPLDFYLAKLIGNGLTFAVPMAILAIGTVATIWFTPLPDGLIVYAMLLFGHVVLAFSLSLSVAMAVESEGWNIFAMIGSTLLINPLMMALGQIPVIADNARTDHLVWSLPAVSILATQIVGSILILVWTGWYHGRKSAFH